MADIKKINPAHMKAILEVTNACPYFKLLSMEIRSLDWGESHLEVDVQKKHLQPYGNVHGGVCASLMDAAAFWAAYQQMPEGVGLTTVEIKVNYLAPVSEGRLIGKGKCIKFGNSICLSEVRIEDDKGGLVSHGTSTMMVLDSLKIRSESGLPPKFLD